MSAKHEQQHSGVLYLAPANNLLSLSVCNKAVRHSAHHHLANDGDIKSKVTSLCSLPLMVQGPGSSSPLYCSKQDHLVSRPLTASISHTDSLLPSPSCVATALSPTPSSFSPPSISAWGKVLPSLCSTPTKTIKASQLVTRSQALRQHCEYAHSSASSSSMTSSTRASLAEQVSACSSRLSSAVALKDTLAGSKAKPMTRAQALAKHFGEGSSCSDSASEASSHTHPSPTSSPSTTPVFTATASVGWARSVDGSPFSPATVGSPCGSSGELTFVSPSALEYFDMLSSAAEPSCPAPVGSELSFGSVLPPSRASTPKLTPKSLSHSQVCFAALLHIAILRKHTGQAFKLPAWAATPCTPSR